MKCVRNYRQHVQYVPLSVCACCGSEDRLRTGSYKSQSEWPDLSVLKVRDPFILSHTPLSRFTYICKDLDGLLLNKQGIRIVNVECSLFEIYFCHDCYGSLRRSTMPRLALNNYLYRGELLEDIENITWVEEMACSIYRTTAHVVRIYGSSSPTDPLQLHGNVCAHPLNICANAKQLPWSPVDLNDLICVVFVGKNKLTEDDLVKLKPFFVRRNVVRMLLSDFCQRNRLYRGLYSLNNTVLNLYPENGLLPGLAERIVYD
ncbi:hypothetical protein GG344DRAFT_45787, partial [Lentinula edodes]